jgi:hypothetical protein
VNKKIGGVNRRIRGVKRERGGVKRKEEEREKECMKEEI